MHHQSTRVSLICARCGATFSVKRCRATVARFCSLNCKKVLLPHPHDSEAMLVPLTRGAFAVIDVGDAVLIASHNWRLAAKRGKRYACADVEGKTIQMHQLMCPLPSGDEIDHIDRDGLNNRRSNLRPATRSQNAHNIGPSTANTSGYLGVSFDRGTGRWKAVTTDQRERIWIGRFHTPEEAARAYDAKVRELFGEFAGVNFPREGE